MCTNFCRTNISRTPPAPINFHDFNFKLLYVTFSYVISLRKYIKSPIANFTVNWPGYNFSVLFVLLFEF